MQDLRPVLDALREARAQAREHASQEFVDYINRRIGKLVASTIVAKMEKDK